MHWNIQTADALSLLLHFSALHGCHPGGRVIGVTWRGECTSDIFRPINSFFSYSVEEEQFKIVNISLTKVFVV
jgi:hypothetical protein